MCASFEPWLRGDGVNTGTTGGERRPLITATVVATRYCTNVRPARNGNASSAALLSIPFIPDIYNNPHSAAVAVVLVLVLVARAALQPQPVNVIGLR